MNVHPDCQDGVPKCQPKSRLLRRQKSASEIDSRIMGIEDDSKSISIASNHEIEIIASLKKDTFKGQFSFYK